MISSLRYPGEGVRAPPVDRYFEFDGARLRYRDEGTGAAVIFVHGWTLDLEMWDLQAAELIQEYRIIRMDRRGFGLSTGRPSLAQDVADVEALCRHLQLHHVALVGMSQGARIVLHLASIAPQRVCALVLDGPPEIDTERDDIQQAELPYDSYRRLARSAGLDSFRREWAKNPLTSLATDDSRAHATLARILQRYPGTDLLDASADPTLATTRRMLATLPQHVLLIGGELDLESRRSAADRLLSDLPHAQRAIIPAAGHLCNMDNPRAYNAALSDFFAHHFIPTNAH